MGRRSAAMEIRVSKTDVGRPNIMAYIHVPVLALGSSCRWSHLCWNATLPPITENGACAAGLYERLLIGTLVVGTAVAGHRVEPIALARAETGITYVQTKDAYFMVSVIVYRR